MAVAKTIAEKLAVESQYAVVTDPQTATLKGALLKDIHRSVYVYRVDCGGCNGCEIEIFASITPLFDVERFGIKVVSSPRHADVLVYTGSMTRSMRVPAMRAYHAAPDPKICVAYGACGCSGGIFHDLYCVWGGADKFIPIDVYIPGCPPTPQALIAGMMKLQEKIDKQSIKKVRWYEKGKVDSNYVPMPILGPDLIDVRRSKEFEAAAAKKEGA